MGGGDGGGGMRANTETSRSSARAGASTTMSIYYGWDLYIGDSNTCNYRRSFLCMEATIKTQLKARNVLVGSFGCLDCFFMAELSS